MYQSTTTVADLMRQSGVGFGTSGSRGLVAAMTDRVCHGYKTSFLQFMVEDGVWARGGHLALAGDLRPSTPRIPAACAQAVRDLGGEPVFCRYVPTPALAYWAFGEGIPSIMVTGSHIPDDRNGIKSLCPDGEIFKDDEPGIARQIVGPGELEWTQDGTFIASPPFPTVTKVGPVYVSSYVDAFGTERCKSCASASTNTRQSGTIFWPEFWQRLGQRYCRRGDLKPIPPSIPKPVRAEDITMAREWAAEHVLDAIASTDGDSDRPHRRVVAG